LWASCPCQPWSAENNNALGAKDERNMFPQYLRVLGEMPWLRATAWENVPRLASDPYFKKIVGHMRALGYGVAARKLNAADLEVPQERERLIVVGIKGATDADAAAAFPTVVAQRRTVGDVLPHVARLEGYKRYTQVYRPASRPMPTITASYSDYR